STHVKRKLAAHLASVLLEKGDEPAEVIEVPMTHDEGIDGRRIDLQELKVVEQRGRREAEIKERLTRLTPAQRFQVKGQAEFVVDVPAQPGAEDDAETLHLDVADLGRTDKSVLVAVHDHADSQAIHCWRCARLGAGWRRIPDGSRHQNCSSHCCTGPYEGSAG